MLNESIRLENRKLSPVKITSGPTMPVVWLLIVPVLVYWIVSLFSPFTDYIDYAISISIITFILFTYNSKNTIAIREFIAIIYATQILLGSALSYIYLEANYYTQPVEQEDYFSFTVPAVLLLIAGLFFPLSLAKHQVFSVSDIKSEMKGKEKVAFILIGIGFAAGFILPYLPGSLAFFFFLLSNVKYVGALYLFFTDSASKYLVLAFIVGLLLLNAIASSMFHDFFLWLTFILLFVTYIKKYSFLLKLAALFVGFIFLFATQAIKGEYRNAIWFGEHIEDKTGYFSSLLESQFTNEAGLFTDNNIEKFIYRINQGWIVAHTMAHTPSAEPFAEGETIIRGITSSILPRFLNPTKYTAGGSEYLERFSGLELVGSTSMNLSPIGEFYANFDKKGAILSMFFFGLLLNFSYTYILKIVRSRPTVILWVPLIFMQVVKAETDFTTVFNHLVKASFIIWLLYWASQRFFKVKL